MLLLSKTHLKFRPEPLSDDLQVTWVKNSSREKFRHLESMWRTQISKGFPIACLRIEISSSAQVTSFWKIGNWSVLEPCGWPEKHDSSNQEAQITSPKVSAPRKYVYNPVFKWEFDCLSQNWDLVLRAPYSGEKIDLNWVNSHLSPNILSPFTLSLFHRLMAVITNILG